MNEIFEEELANVKSEEVGVLDCELGEVTSEIAEYSRSAVSLTLFHLIQFQNTKGRAKQEAARLWQAENSRNL